MPFTAYVDDLKLNGNIVNNGGFETGDFTNWSTDNKAVPPTITSATSASGVYAAKMSLTGDGWSVLYYNLGSNLSQSDTVEISYYIDSVMAGFTNFYCGVYDSENNTKYFVDLYEFTNTGVWLSASGDLSGLVTSGGITFFVAMGYSTPPFISINFDDLKVNGATVDNGGFEYGNLTNWYYDEEFNPFVVTDELAASGTYSVHAYVGGVIGYLGYNLGNNLSQSDIVSISYYVSSYHGGSIKVYVTDNNNVKYLVVSDTFDTNTWITASTDLSGLNTSNNIYFVIEVYGFYSGFATTTVDIDDVTIEPLELEGFVNSGFEYGDLTGWTVNGSASVVTSPVYNGSYSCKLESGAQIKQLIDITNVGVVRARVNVPQPGTVITVSLIQNNNPIVSANVNYQTSGWIALNLDASQYTGNAYLAISSTGGTSYVDYIQLFDNIKQNSPPLPTFDTNLLFHFHDNYYGYSTINPTAGINGSACIELYPHYNYCGDSYSGVYTYVDLTQCDRIQFYYRIPVFDNSYANYYCAWFKALLEKEGSQPIEITIADKTQGVTTDWTLYTIDVSQLTGIYKFTLYAKTHDMCWVLHPSILVQVDDLTLYSGVPLRYNIYTYMSKQLQNKYSVNYTQIIQRQLKYSVLFRHYISTPMYITSMEESSIDDTGIIFNSISHNGSYRLTYTLSDCGKYIVRYMPLTKHNSEISRKIHLYTLMALRVRHDV